MNCFRCSFALRPSVLLSQYFVFLSLVSLHSQNLNLLDLILAPWPAIGLWIAVLRLEKNYLRLVVFFLNQPQSLVVLS